MIGDETFEAGLSLAAAFILRCGRPPRENHLSLDHHCSKLSVGTVYRGLQDDRAPPHMDRHGDAGKPLPPAGAKDIRLRLDRGCTKPWWDVEPSQCSTEIVGECRHCPAMHTAAVVEMTVIHIELAD